MGHKKCSEKKTSLSSVAGSFLCKVCVEVQRPAEVVTVEGLDLEGDVEGVRKFCYLGDLLNAGGGAESASVTRVICTWGKFREFYAY